MKNKFLPLVALLLTIISGRSQQTKSEQVSIKLPILGWSSWNNFRVHINEQLIKSQADAMVWSGLYAAGYRYINIDDGYFGGRDSSGNLIVDKAKFPSGLKHLVEYIHSKGLKAGIYSDAGRNTCGSMWDGDKNGIGVGLYDHLEQDANFFFGECKFDFIKVDWCGGQQLKLEPKNIYPNIIQYIKKLNPNVVFNVCTWEFPGTWAVDIADSWRISQDIKSDFPSVLEIVDINKKLSPYQSPGHYNDMDMLQVGRGMSYEEDKTHFSMWCMLNSPLLAGNDLRSMSDTTISILGNKEMIAINQYYASKQARLLFSDNDIEVWEKEISSKNNQSKVIALLNRGDATNYTLLASKINIGNNAKLHDLWLHKEIGVLGKQRTFSIPKHGIVVLKING